MTRGPNPISVGWSVFRSLFDVRRPGPFDAATADHSRLQPPLEKLASDGPSVLAALEPDLSGYLDPITRLEPDSLTRADALAYWINVYNAGALLLAGRAQAAGEDSVLGIPGGFQERFISVAGERLSLDNVEHGKLRRFKDPRIHSALVCGSVSCPTLRSEPYEGSRLEAQLDDQMRSFLAGGALVADRSTRVVRLSRVFLWFGSDFVRPHRMPTFLPVRRSRILESLRPWLEPEMVAWLDDARPEVEFQSYDWGLSCTVG